MTAITGVRTVSIPVTDQDRALAFYVDKLGLTKLHEYPTPSGGRFIELSLGGGDVNVALERSDSVAAGIICVRFLTFDAEAAHSTLSKAGVDVDDILRWPGVPPMFSFRDPDGNLLSVTEPG